MLNLLSFAFYVRKKNNSVIDSTVIVFFRMRTKYLILFEFATSSLLDL